MIVEPEVSIARVCRCDEAGGIARDEKARETVVFAWSDAVNKVADNAQTVKVGDSIYYQKTYRQKRGANAGCATDEQLVAASWYRPKSALDAE